MAAIIVSTTSDVVNANDGVVSLREAIALANTNPDADTITFAYFLAGQTVTLTGGALLLNQDVTIDGDVDGDNKADIAISGNNATRIFNMAGATTDVHLRSLSLTNGYAAGDGGAIFANAIASLAIADTTISNNTAAGSGGGLVAFGSKVTLTNALVSSNHADTDGGGLSASGESMTLANTTVDGNTANGHGGGIAVAGALTLRNSTLTNNHADVDGGGIANPGSTVTVTNSVVADNTSGTYHAANDVAGAITTATNSVFGTPVAIATNTSSLTNVTEIGLAALADNGGTVMTRDIQQGSVLIDAGNNAAAAGLATDANGNTRISGGTVDIGATEIQNLVVTTASDVVNADDGKLSLREAVTLATAGYDFNTITFASSLAGKTIKLTGGELAITYGDLTIDGDINGDNRSDITISGNNASRIFYMSGYTTDVELLSLTLTNGHTGYRGGAVYAKDIASLDIVDTTIRNNTATDGGGLFAFNTDTSLTNSLVSGNHATGFGGGLYSQNKTLTLTNTTVDGNTAKQFGGGIRATSSTLTLLNSTVTENHADTDGTSTIAGGGIDNFVALSIIITNSVVAENISGKSLAANDIKGTVDFGTNSFFGTTVDITTSSYSIQNGGIPRLGGLLDNGGTVLTRSPLDGSPLIGAGLNGGLPQDIHDIDHDGNTGEILPRDGRDGLRIVASTVDIGAVERIVNERITGTASGDLIIGGRGNDNLNGGGGSDLLIGGTGRDKLNGGDGRDRLIGGNGGDRLVGGDGRDKLNGGNGNDTLNGSAGRDVLNGGENNDMLNGGSGNDTVTGAGGRDVLRGGGGADSFDFNKVTDSALGSQRDDIVDFSKADDVIDLSGIDARTGAGNQGNQTFHFIGTSAFTGTKGELRALNSSADSIVVGDVNGDGNADFSILVEGVHNLQTGDFVL